MTKQDDYKVWITLETGMKVYHGSFMKVDGKPNAEKYKRIWVSLLVSILSFGVNDDFRQQKYLHLLCCLFSATAFKFSFEISNYYMVKLHELRKDKLEVKKSIEGNISANGEIIITSDV